ncbi:MAG: helix-turn-helix domain-containing protein [bacterium]|nr:helix-turn-helix domain-containing protein [bacterium]
MFETLLTKAGLSDKAAKIYLTLLQSGPQSVRKLAEAASINRGTTYDILKELQGYGVVTFFHKEKKQYFVAEDPESVIRMVEARASGLSDVASQLATTLPALRALRDSGSAKPVARYYEGSASMRSILEEVLDEVATVTPSLYRVYSALNIREHLYRGWPDFTQSRISRGISVRVIALGEGGELSGLDERRWLQQGEGAATYTIITPTATVMISLRDDGELIGVVVDDSRTAATQTLIFDNLWEHLPASVTRNRKVEARV